MEESVPLGTDLEALCLRPRHRITSGVADLEDATFFRFTYTEINLGEATRPSVTRQTNRQSDSQTVRNSQSEVKESGTSGWVSSVSPVVSELHKHK
eukprot:1194837-Prorocentrum_minimum.AAC.5